MLDPDGMSGGETDPQPGRRGLVRCACTGHSARGLEIPVRAERTTRRLRFPRALASASGHASILIGMVCGRAAQDDAQRSFAGPDQNVESWTRTCAVRPDLAAELVAAMRLAFRNAIVSVPCACA